MNQVEQATPAKRFDAQKILYVTVVILFWGSLYMYAPTLPNFIKSRVDNLAIVGVIMSMYGLWQMVFRLPLGIASDISGRRKPYIIAGLLCSALGAWMLGAATNQNSMLVARSITGLSAAAWVPLLVFFSQFYAPGDALKATSLLTFVSSIARMAFTSVTGFLNNAAGYTLAFNLSAVSAGLAALLMLLIREESLPARKHDVKGILNLITRRDVLGPGLLNLILQYVSYTTTFGFLPILARQLGAGDVLLSMLMSLYLLALTIGNLSAALLLKRTSLNSLLYSTFILTAVAIVIASISRSYWPVIGAQVLAGFAMGIGLPLMMGMSIQRVETGDRATAMGLHQAVYAVGMFLGPWASGYLADSLGIQPMFALTAVVSLILGILGLRWLNYKPPTESSA